MATKYANKLQPGDTVVVSEGNIQTVKFVEPSSHRNVSIKFEGGHSMIVGATVQLPVMRSKYADTDLTIEDVYNMILDDKMSLAEFTMWVSRQK